MSLVIALMTFIFTSCGGGSNSGSSSGGGSSSSLAEYAGKWELFQPSNGPTESATFTLL